jgi:hypothetical protein
LRVTKLSIYRRSRAQSVKDLIDSKEKELKTRIRQRDELSNAVFSSRDSVVNQRWMIRLDNIDQEISDIRASIDSYYTELESLEQITSSDASSNNSSDTNTRNSRLPVPVAVALVSLLASILAALISSVLGPVITRPANPEANPSPAPDTLPIIPSQESDSMDRNTKSISQEGEEAQALDQNSDDNTPGFSLESEEILSEQMARQLINDWLGAKKDIYAPPYNRLLASQYTAGNLLNDIQNPDPLRGSVNWLQRNNASWHYGNSEIREFWEFEDNDPSYATALVFIYEERKYIEGNKPQSPRSPGPRTFRYTFNKLEDGAWKISDYCICNDDECIACSYLYDR